MICIHRYTLGVSKVWKNESINKCSIDTLTPRFASVYQCIQSTFSVTQSSVSFSNARYISHTLVLSFCSCFVFSTESSSFAHEWWVLYGVLWMFGSTSHWNMSRPEYHCVSCLCVTLMQHRRAEKTTIKFDSKWNDKCIQRIRILDLRLRLRLRLE